MSLIGNRRFFIRKMKITSKLKSNITKERNTKSSIFGFQKSTKTEKCHMKTAGYRTVLFQTRAPKINRILYRFFKSQKLEFSPHPLVFLLLLFAKKGIVLKPIFLATYQKLTNSCKRCFLSGNSTKFATGNIIRKH